MSKETGGAAFPQFAKDPWGNTGTRNEGMALRDYFAAKAMQAIHTHDEGFGWTAKEIAVTAYAQADAMLEARK